MKLGIVGHEGAKFNERTHAKALHEIEAGILRHKPSVVISGACHLGGIDIWAIELAKAMGIATKEFPAEVHSWGKPGGFKDRNCKIAFEADLVLVIVVAELPRGYGGMRFPTCYHCHNLRPNHVKSGGCWTAKQARAAEWRVV